MGALFNVLDPEKVHEYSFSEHVKLVQDSKLNKDNLPVFLYRRMTTRDMLSLGDETYVRTVDPITGNQVVTTKEGDLQIKMIKKYWVGAKNLTTDQGDKSFTPKDRDKLLSTDKVKFDMFMNEKMSCLTELQLTLLYSIIRFGSRLPEDQAKN